MEPRRPRDGQEPRRPRRRRPRAGRIRRSARAPARAGADRLQPARPRAPIGKGIGIADVIDDPRLREVEYGRWEGMVYDDLIKDPHYIHYREHPLDEPT